MPNLGISTNGTLLDAARSRAILDSPLDTLMIAVDGTSKAVYERIRISSTFTFEQVVENVRGFLSLKRSLGRSTPHTILSIIVMQETQDQLDDFRAFWLAAGADEVLFKGYTTWGDQTADFVELAVPSAREAHHREFPCSFLWESLVIAWNGRVVPCCYDYDAKSTMGDLNTHSLWEIWNGEAYRTLRRRELDGSNNSPLCGNCSQAPGHPQNPLWPIPLQVQRTVSGA